MALVLADFQDWADSADADKVYVAVGNDDDDNVSMLQWAIQHFSHHKFYIIRVHHTSEITSPYPNGELALYLKGLSEEAEEVPSYVASHPFGRVAITPKHLHWNFYSRVLHLINANEN